MSTGNQAAVELRAAIEHIEEAYEFMLAYAAQGRPSESDTTGESQIRGFLTRMRAALDVFSTHIPNVLSESGSGAAFGEHFLRDTQTMKSVVDLVTDHANITSDMIDNTNGMIAVRSFLTDMFFLDQVLLPARTQGGTDQS